MIKYHYYCNKQEIIVIMAHNEVNIIWTTVYETIYEIGYNCAMFILNTG